MHIEFHKIHLAYQAHEKHTQDEMHLKNYLVALIKETLSKRPKKGILGWASGAKSSEGALRSEGNMTTTLPAPLRSHALLQGALNNLGCLSTYSTHFGILSFLVY